MFEVLSYEIQLFLSTFTYRTTDCVDDRLLFRRQMLLDFAGKGRGKGR